MKFNEEYLLESYLESLDPPVTNLIPSCMDDKALRAFACRCARVAMEYASVDDLGLSNVLSIAEAYSNGSADSAQLDAAGIDAGQLVRDFEAEENRQYETDASEKAFKAARVAYAVYACTVQSARCAAAFACYEAETAIEASLNPTMRAKINQIATEMLQLSG